MPPQSSIIARSEQASEQASELALRPHSAALLLAMLAALAAVPEGAARAQSCSADQALEDLIPDAALDDPTTWAHDTDAARTTVPDATALLAPEAIAPLTDIPAITLEWPDASPLPAIAPLTPDPDIALAAEQAKAAGETLGPDSDRASGQIPGATLIPVTPQLALAFPPDPQALPEREAITTRFGAIASLRKFGNEEDNLAQLTRRARQDIDLLQRVLRVYGYYDAEVTQSTTGYAAPSEGSGPAPAIDLRKVGVRFDVLPGPRYTLARIGLGDIAAAPDAAVLSRAFALAPGDPVNADRIAEQRDHLIAALGEGGHAFANVGQPDLAIDHAARTGDLTLPVTSGGQYTIGRITSSLPDYLSARHLGRIARFRSGDPFRRSRIDDFRQAILATGLVSAVTITPREAAPPVAAADGVKPGTADIDVKLVKAPQRTIAGLIGYSSGEGVRLEASWENRNFFPPEGLVRFRGVVGTREQLAGATYRRNNFFGRDQVLTADLYAQTRDTNAYNARTLSFLTSIEKQTTLIFQKAWVFSAGAEVLATSELPAGAGATRTTYFIGALPLRGAYDGSDDLLDPKRGFRISLRLSPEISVQNGQRSSYARVQFDASTYRPVSSNVILAGRVRLGTIPGTDVASIAPSRRFYAGGGASVRGFAYQAVGPRDALGNPSGGRSLTEFSLEARVKTGLLGGAVSVVPFVDAGTVGTTASPTTNGLKIGAGIGMRYQTSFGPIRIDLGTPVNPSKGDSRIGVYVSLGQAF